MKLEDAIINIKVKVPKDNLNKLSKDIEKDVQKGLVRSFKASTKILKAGLKGASKGLNFASKAGNAIKFFEAIKNSLLESFNLAKGIVDQFKNEDELAKGLGVSINELTRLRKATTGMGISKSTFDTIASNLQDSFTDVDKADKLRSLGINTNQSIGDQLGQILDKISRTNEASQRFLVKDLLGVGYGQVSGALKGETSNKIKGTKLSGNETTTIGQRSRLQADFIGKQQAEQTAFISASKKVGNQSSNDFVSAVQKELSYANASLNSIDWKDLTSVFNNLAQMKIAVKTLSKGLFDIANSLDKNWGRDLATAINTGTKTIIETVLWIKNVMPRIKKSMSNFAWYISHPIEALFKGKHPNNNKGEAE